MPRGQASARPPIPRWVWWALVAGSAGLMAWGWALSLFHTSSAAVGVALSAWSVLSTLAALSGIATLFNALIFRDDRRRRGLATGAAIMMTATIVGAAAGIPVLAAIYSKRNASRN